MFGIMRRKRTSLVALTTQEGPVKRGAVDCRCRGDAQSPQPRADDFACRRGASPRVAVLDALFKPVFDDYEYSSRYLTSDSLRLKLFYLHIARPYLPKAKIVC